MHIERGAGQQEPILIPTLALYNCQTFARETRDRHPHVWHTLILEQPA